MIQGRGARAEPRSGSVDCLIVQTAAERHSVHVGNRATVGRRADIAIAQNDDAMHEVVCAVIAHRDWSIEVPEGNVLWVDVLRVDGSGRLVSIEPGTRWSSSEPSVEVRVRTRAANYRFTLDHVTSGVASRVPATTRRTSDGLLQLHRAPDRALVVACANRLDLHSAAFMEDEEVGLLLGCTPGAAKRRINRALENLVVSMEEAGEVVPDDRHDRQLRAAAVDWLVCTGTVTRALLDQATAAERSVKGYR